MAHCCATALLAVALCLCLVQPLIATGTSEETIQVPFYVSLPVLEQVDLGRSSKAGGRLPKGWIPRSYALHLVSKKLVINERLATNGASENPEASTIGIDSSVYTSDGQPAHQMVSKVIILDSATPFNILLDDKLPFQETLGCRNRDIGNGIDQLYNGPHNLEWTNLHVHGLRVDPGAIEPEDSCDDFALTQGVSREQFYCNDPPTNGQGVCEVFSDNVYVFGRPNAPPPGFKQIKRYTYPLPEHLPGLNWYHTHQHGSVGLQTQTAHGPIIVDEKSAKGGLNRLFFPIKRQKPSHYGCMSDCHKSCSVHNWAPRAGEKPQFTSCMQTCIDTCPADCNDLREILREQPNTKAPVLVISALFARQNTDPEVCSAFGAEFCEDDDNVFFLGCRGKPSYLLNCPGVEEGQQNPYENIHADRNGTQVDWYMLNGAIQPAITITAKRYQRLQIVDTQVMKWMNLAVFEKPAEGSGGVFTKPAPCTWLLLAKDGVFLPQVPRLIRTSGPLGDFPSLILVPGQRVDVLLRCEAVGEYFLVSGAGPYDKHPECEATHCELVGRPPYSPFVPQFTGNNFYKGQRYSAAILATVNVVAPQRKKKYSSSSWWNNAGLDAGLSGGYHYTPSDDWLWGGVDDQEDQVLTEPVCNTRLSDYPYLNEASFSPETINQCFSFNNQGAGAACNINGCVFGQYEACIDQGSTQLWTLQDITFHPFHLHETPMVAKALPECLNNTNFYEIGDWQDVWHFPTCTSCQTVNGVRTCDQAVFKFTGTVFSTIGSLPASMRQGQPAPGTCQERYSVFHCHVLQHEDEGCMAVLRWACRNPVTNAPTCPPQFLGVCNAGPDATCVQQNLNFNPIPVL